MMHQKVIVLLSGGLDSITVLSIVKKLGYNIFCLSFNYGQKHSQEIQYAKKIAEMYQVHHQLVNIDCKIFSGSSLLDHDLNVPKNEAFTSIPNTYVPGRNTIFLSYALAYAESIEASKIFIGVNALDYSGYPDCRPEYIEAFNNLSQLALAKSIENKLQVTVEAPLQFLTKAEIIALGLKNNVDYSYTFSCYDPQDAHACRTCQACILRLAGFAANNYKDPIPYITVQ